MLRCDPDKRCVILSTELMVLVFSDIFGRSRKSSAITRNNQIYLMENMIPNYNLIAALLSLNCITQLQSHSIQRQRSIQDKNAELLKVVGSFDKKQFTDFIKCLRQTYQKTVARIMENGGGLQLKSITCISNETPAGSGLELSCCSLLNKQNVEVEQYNNSNQGKTIRNICHLSHDVRVRVLVPEKRR